MIGHVLASSDTGSAVSAWVMVIVLFFFYWVPTIVAAARGVPNAGSVFVINLFLGWTFIGWVVALAMAMRSRPYVPGAKKCPDCAETVLADARVCRHCGYRFAPPADGKAEPKPTSQPRGNTPKTREKEPRTNPPTSTNALRRGDPVQILKTGHRLTGKTGKVVEVLSTGYVAVRVGLWEYTFSPDQLKPKPESSN